MRKQYFSVASAFCVFCLISLSACQTSTQQVTCLPDGSGIAGDPAGRAFIAGLNERQIATLDAKDALIQHAEADASLQP